MMSFLVNILPSYFAATGDLCNLPKNGFFFLPPWWEYIPTKINDLGDCAVAFVVPSSTWLVGLAILDMLLRLAGFLAVMSIIIAGFQLQFSGGNPEKAASARKRVFNSMYGLVIALIATAVVTFIGNQLSK